MQEKMPSPERDHIGDFKERHKALYDKVNSILKAGREPKERVRLLGMINESLDDLLEKLKVEGV